ncbi:MAG: Gfo/Idh/MocA family oxidoreductase, partial [Firmicutes bacterium]|nr:Gfo/Idh/MocA family oxidoreductase [Bacillota bacterium]
MSKDPIRVGIIGTGGIAGAYARAYREIPEAEVVGLCDIVSGKAAAYGEREGFAKAKTYVCYQDMLEELELDAISVSTPNASHASITIDCLETGKHVLCEKPMSVTLDEAVAMARAAKKANRILSIGFQPRYDPNMQAIRDLVQSGILGKIYYVETGGGRRRGMPGGSFINRDQAGFGAIAD